MLTLEEMRKLRGKITADIRAILDKSKGEKRDLNDEEAAKCDELLAEDEKLEKDIARAERLEKREKDLDAAPSITEPIRTDKGPQPGEDRAFKNMGEFFMSVIKAEDRTVPPDPRLIEIRAASGMSEAVGSEGLYLVGADHSKQLLEHAFATGKLPGKCTLQPIGAASNRLNIPGVDETSRADGSRQGGIEMYWESEAGTKTATRPKYRLIELSLKKLIGACYLTDDLLADTVALGPWLKRAFGREFGFKLDDAIYRGPGAGVPLGMLTSACLVSVAKEPGQTAGTIVADNVKKAYARMPAHLMDGAEWYINQALWPQIFDLHLVVGMGGAPLFVPPNGLSAAPFGTLLGRPIVPLEQASAPGTIGDLLFANVGEMILAEKGGMQTATSIHVRFLNDEQVMRFVVRLDGQPSWHDKVTPYKGSDKIGPFVAIASRT